MRHELELLLKDKMEEILEVIPHPGYVSFQPNVWLYNKSRQLEFSINISIEHGDHGQNFKGLDELNAWLDHKRLLLKKFAL